MVLRGAIRSAKRIDDLDSSGLEIAPVSGHHRQPMNESRRCDQAVFDRHGPAHGAEVGQKPRPTQPRGRYPRKAVNALDTLLKPTLQTRAAFPSWQEKNTETDLAEDDGVDGDLPLMTRQPFQDPGIGLGPGSLAQNVGVNQERHG